MTSSRRILALLVVVAGVLIGTAQTVAAQEGDDEPAAESVQGTLIDRKGTRDREDDEPVVGAGVIVETAEGEEVGVALSDEDGRFRLDLPGPGAYVATLDLESLPEGVGLTDEDEAVIEFSVDRQSQRLIYDLGARERVAASRLDRVPQLAFEGVMFGLIIAITSVGLSLIFGTTGLVNFSHGEHVTWGAVVAWWINVDHGIHLVPAAILAIIIGGLTGAIVDRVLWRWLRGRGVSLVAMMIVSIGLSLAARNVIQLLYGETAKPYREFNIQRGVDFGPITASPKDFWIIGLALTAVVGVALTLQFTRIGKAMRAVADSPDLAASTGINVDRVISTVWFSGGALAALGGVLFGVWQRTQFNMGFLLLLLMFAGVVLGGLGTAYGALVGSFVVGMLIQLSTLVIPTELKNVGALAVLILVLLVRPRGILGRAERIA